MQLKDLNPILHSQLRLKIVSHLMAAGGSDFSEVKEVTGASSGNISVQIKKLQEVGYIEVEKGFKNNYQHTALSMTEKGTKAFEAYVEELKKYLNLKHIKVSEIS
ncbi:MAG: transcriptional regulator [Cyanobacteria bacterium J06614_10]